MDNNFKKVVLRKRMKARIDKKPTAKKIILKKPPSKAVRKAKKRIDDIKEILPLSQFIPSNPNNPNNFISDKSASKQSKEAIAMIHKAMKGSKKYMVV
jgi:hypothetical protein